MLEYFAVEKPVSKVPVEDILNPNNPGAKRINSKYQKYASICHNNTPTYSNFTFLTYTPLLLWPIEHFTRP